jgi:hypothetical protein
VRSGVMVDTEERHKLREIDDPKRILKVDESFQTNSDAIDTKHAFILEDLKKRLDDPEANAVEERYYAPEAEMSVMERKVDLFGNPSLLFEQQRKLQRQINTLYSEQYDLISRLRKDDTQYYDNAGLSEDWFRPQGWWDAGREAEVGEGPPPPRSYLNSHYRFRLWSRSRTRSTTVKR